MSTSTPRDGSVTTHGFTAVPCSSQVLFQEQPPSSQPQPTSPSEISLPDTRLSRQIRRYAEQNLPKPTFYHSMRVFYFGEAIRQQHFPDWKFSTETWLVTCLLHDIGTVPENLKSTMMSFDLWGGMRAHTLVFENGGESAQADGVAEAIMRHQDVMIADGSEPEGSLARRGKITALGQLIQLATLFDNMGAHEELVNMATVEAVVQEWPRLGWNGCFADVLEEELKLKPWAHTSKSGEREFPDGVRHNKLMMPFE